MTLYFYSNRDPQYGCFSNFSNHSFQLDNLNWPTSEHYFQAQKFVDTEHYIKVQKAKSPSIAAKLGRDRSLPLRKDWEEVKEDAMYEAIKAKFNQNKDIKDVLLSTGNQELVEDSPTDYYWGVGADRTGRNRLGVLLMRLRDELNQEIQKS